MIGINYKKYEQKTTDKVGNVYSSATQLPVLSLANSNDFLSCFCKARLL